MVICQACLIQEQLKPPISLRKDEPDVGLLRASTCKPRRCAEFSGVFRLVVKFPNAYPRLVPRIPPLDRILETALPLRAADRNEDLVIKSRRRFVPMRHPALEFLFGYLHRCPPEIDAVHEQFRVVDAVTQS